MRNCRFLLGLALVFLCHIGFAQTKSPEEFLGYQIGERFTPHHRIMAYLEHVVETNELVTMVHYGESYEWRPLVTLFVSSKQNIQQLETIRTDNLRRTGMMTGTPSTHIPVIWMSYNVHGNEAVASETALMTLWDLIDPSKAGTKKWLENTVVAIDPCLNPDGHARYVDWYNQKANVRLQPDPQSVEHAEPWPGGRPNHYMYDLNRDWAWQVQKESQLRATLYNQWMPQVHVDFHEQGINAPYFFAPAAEPIHEFVTPFQREFQQVVGKNNAKYFDQEAWLYFTREVFDLFYPSYGDTWPTFNGAIGMTYEQAGSGRAGLGIVTALGDTLTLYDRIIHHHTAGLATIETVSTHADRLISEFEKYFREGAANPQGRYKSFVLKSGNTPDKVNALKKLLDGNGIKYGYSKARKGVAGYSYASGNSQSFDIQGGDLIVSAYQPKSVLVQTLFEPHTALPDSMTYDITSWALPYAYGLEAYATEERISFDEQNPAEAGAPQPITEVAAGQMPLAYVTPWNATVHARFLGALLREKIRVRYSTREFAIAGKTFEAGSLIIGREGNENRADFHQLVTNLAREYTITFEPVYTGYVDSGNDFGSSAVRAITQPKIAVLSGSGVSSLNFGEIWHFIEQELDYALTILDASRFGSLDLTDYNVLIMPSGSYMGFGDSGMQKLNAWISAGGKLIAFDSAIGSLVGKPGFGISRYFNDEEQKAFEKMRGGNPKEDALTPFSDRQRERVTNSVAGAVFSVRVDRTHPLGYGMGDHYYTLKNNATRYSYLRNGVNVGVITSMNDHKSGYIGEQAKINIPESLVFGVESRGRGQIIYFADNPIFRGFWESGKMIVNNAIFMVGQ